jgi:hypothetical protein
MTLALKGLDELEGIEAQGAIRSPVVFEVPLAIAFHPVGGHQSRLDGALRNPAGGAMQGNDTTG